MVLVWGIAPFGRGRTGRGGNFVEKTMENILVPMRTLQPGDGTEAEAVNVRRHGKNAVSAVGKPMLAGVLQEGDRLVGYDRRGGRIYYFSARGNSIVLSGYYSGGGGFTAVNRVIADTGNEIGECLPSGDFVVVSTSGGLLYMHYLDGDYAYLGGAPEFPVMAFGTTGRVTLSAEVPGRELSGYYGEWAGTLQASDLSAMERQVEAASGRIERQAREGGRLLRPVVVRTALRLWDGTLLWSPDATLTGTYSAPSAVASVAMEGDGSYRVGRTALQQEAWKLSVTLVSPGIGSWKHLVKAVEIYVSGAEDAGNGSASFRCETSHQGAPEYFLRIQTGGSSAAAMQRRLALIQNFKLIATISDIEALTGGRITAEGIAPATDGAGGEMTASTYGIDIADSGKEEVYNPAVPLFSATVMTTAGDRCFAGGVKMKLPEAPRYGSMVSPDGIVKEAASVTVAVEVACQEGKAMVVGSSLSEMWSRRLNGLITYPDRRAVRITVTVAAGGSKYSLSLPMYAMPGCDAAYAATDGGYELQTDAGDTVYADSGTVEDKPCLLLASGAANPLRWIECGKAGNRGIVALSPSLGLGSSWQLGRHSLCLFAAEGIYLLSFDTKGDCTGANLLSRRTVQRKEAVVPVADGVAFVDSLGEVCRMAGTKVKPTGIFAESGDCVAGYSQRFDEVWAEAQESLLVVESGGTFYRRRHGEMRLARLQDMTVATDGAGFYSIEREQADEAVEVELRTRTVDTGCGRRMCRALWNIVGDNAGLRLTVYGENGRSCCGNLISCLAVDGTVGAPIVHRFIAPYERTARLEIAGSMMPGTVVEDCRLYLK